MLIRYTALVTDFANTFGTDYNLLLTGGTRGVESISAHTGLCRNLALLGFRAQGVASETALP